MKLLSSTIGSVSRERGGIKKEDEETSPEKKERKRKESARRGNNKTINKRCYGRRCLGTRQCGNSHKKERQRDTIHTKRLQVK
jgi:hypothetical protein